jgi:ATP-dependent helicase/nuclease subunit A
VPDLESRQQLSTALDTTFFVEAGAGTGKTRELVARVVALVASGRVRMSGLAAITFTDAAAAELRDRIRRELAHAALPAGVRSEDERARCLEASRSVDQASIQTIHAFAANLLRTFPLEAALPPGFAIWDEMQRDSDFTERFRAWLYDEVPNGPAQAAVARALALGLPVERLSLLAQRMQEHYDLLADDSTWAAPALSDAVATARDCGRALLDLLPLCELARDGDADPLVQEVRPIQFAAQRLAQASTEAEAFESLLRYSLKRPNPQRSTPARWIMHSSNASPVLIIREQLKDVAERIEQELEAQRASSLADLLGHLRDFTIAYARARKSRGVATFHDLLVWSRDLVRDHAGVRRLAHGRIDRLFVDEFQDTDPLQAELVAYLCADPALAEERDWTRLLAHIVPGKLFVVGDPKQSIYRFRRADVGVYQRVYAAACQPGAATASLEQTFRAVSPLVDWVNAHFSAVMHGAEGLQSAYTPLEPRPGLPDVTFDDAHGGVRVVGGPDDLRAGERWAVEAERLARLARKAVADAWPITEQIDGVWHVRPATYRDICVLLPTRTNLRRLERAFEQHDVPYRMESGSLVVFTQEVRELVACLRAIEDPSDQVALVAALRSPAYACSDVDLLSWMDAGGHLSYLAPGAQDSTNPVAAALSSLLEFHTRRTERSAAETIEALIRDRALALYALDHPRPREALRRQRYVVALARKLAAAGDSTLRGFVHWIETLRKNEFYDAESPVPDSDENAVRFKTIHGSKGLEYPIVFLSGLGGGQRPNDGVQLVANHATGALEARITARVGPAFCTQGFDADREKQANDAEQLRLLYVAATRAREHLVLCLSHSFRYGKSSHAAAICDQLPNVPDGLIRPIVHTDLEPFAPAASTPPPSAGQPLAADAATTSFEAHIEAESAWLRQRAALLASLGHERVVTPSGLAHEAPPSEPAVDSDDDTVIPLRSSRGGVPLGVAVHSVLQYVDLESLANLDVLATSAAALNAVRADDVRRLARNAALSEPVRSAVASEKYWREVPLNVAVDGVLVEGAIDLLYQEPDGSLVVVDFKTDHVPASAAEARGEAYRPQAESYAIAVGDATGRSVVRVELVFAATASTHADVVTLDVHDLSATRAAIAIAT